MAYDPPEDHRFVEIIAALVARVPRGVIPPLTFFAMLARKGCLFNQQYLWTCEEVTAGRMTEIHQRRRLARLLEEMLAPTDLPPLPVKFSC